LRNANNDKFTDQSTPPVKATSKSINLDGTLRIKRSPEKRYVGAFGVTGWATRSGLGLLTFGERVRIERYTPQSGKGRLAKPGRSMAQKRVDVVVRFTNSRGEEVGRLENDSAGWISTLLDQRICHFDGSCVFAPDRIRTNDTIYLQIRCYLLCLAFESISLANEDDSNRRTGIFEAKESNEERELRLRQVAFVRLLDEIKLQPTKVNDEAEKRKRHGLLQAAENAELRSEKTAVEKKPPLPSSGSVASSPPLDENEQEGEELQQDQLDALYKKAQAFDFDTPEGEPPDTFALTLRRYQKQALFWMVSKEKDQKIENREESLHPLWDEYIWPVKDADDKDLPEVEGQSKFYLNPYSGEITLDFPTQEQHCLGGILADGKCHSNLRTS
jgi:DNA repair protein RAD5